MTDQARLNLITDPWLPVRRRSGRTETIAPWAVNDRIDTEPVTVGAIDLMAHCGDVSMLRARADGERHRRKIKYLHHQDGEGGF